MEHSFFSSLAPVAYIKILSIKSRKEKDYEKYLNVPIPMFKIIQGMAYPNKIDFTSLSSVDDKTKTFLNKQLDFVSFYNQINYLMLREQYPNEPFVVVIKEQVGDEFKTKFKLFDGVWFPNFYLKYLKTDILLKTSNLSIHEKFNTMFGIPNSDDVIGELISKCKQIKVN